MFSYIIVGMNDMDVVCCFYDVLFVVMDVCLGVFDEKGWLLYFKDGWMFGVIVLIDG